MATETSEQGIASLKLLEGDVLHAYRDAVGRWTIGPGLTAASGVVTPKAGMVITRSQSDQLMARALKLRYEPAVARAMPGAAQHEFDAGVSFHWNTGAIARASWAKAWRGKPRNWNEVARRFLLWTKGGGKVLPGLVRRRNEELRLMRTGIYAGAPVPDVSRHGLARWAISVTPAEITRIRAGFTSLGFAPGADPSGVSVESVRAFQSQHALHVDGIIGRATLSTLQRRLDARKKGATTAATSVAATAAPPAAGAASAPIPDWAIWLIAAVVAVIVLRLAWSYRDVLAVKVQRFAPGLARKLRSF